MLQADGSRMSASQNLNRLISSIVFYPSFLVTRLLIFDHFPLVNVERRCWLMGPECQPHNPRNSLISWLFFTCDIASTWLYFRSHPSNNAAGWWVPKVSLSVQENLRKIQKRTFERRFEHKTSISETWPQRCLATARTSWLFINVIAPS